MAGLLPRHHRTKLAGDPLHKHTHSHRDPLEPTLIVNTPTLWEVNFAENKLENRQNPESFDVCGLVSKPG